MPATTAKSTFGLGVRDGLPFILVVGPFAVVFGVAAAELGLTNLQAFAFSTIVIAGAAQITALQLLSDGAPLPVAIVTALAVNLRMAMYSASLVRYLGPAPLWKRALASYGLVDQSYACSIRRFEEFPEWSVAERLAYFGGAIAPVLPAWVILTVVGAAIGTTLPAWLALDFAVPICFLAIIAPMLRTIAHLAAAATSILVALVFSGMPYSTGLILAALAAMAVGAEVERRMTLVAMRRSET